VLRFRKRAQLPAEFVTLLLPVANGCVGLGECQEIKQDREEIQVRGYRYSNPKGNHFFFFAQSERWELAGWSSDASFLYGQSSLNNDLLHIIFCGGSFVENDGRRLFAAKRKIARCEWRCEGATRQLFCTDEDALVCVAGEAITEPVPALRGGRSRGKREVEL